jgi:NAD(P)-dependent dehydrogenase (short-subunit alcohol dehydrogenase family)
MNLSVDLHGKVALITGGARGIGKAITSNFLNSGAKVLVMDYSDDCIEGLRQEYSSSSMLSTFKGDIRHRDDLERVRDEIVQSNIGLDILIANAGVNVRTPALNLKDEDLRLMLETNLYGSFITMQTFAPLLIQKLSGNVIVTSSVVAFYGETLRAAYTATKAGLSGLIRSLAHEWGQYGVTVNAVGPGVIHTPLIQNYMNEYPERVNDVIAHTPLGRLGTPEDIADVVLFMASDASRFITGQTIVVDGGFSAGTDMW